MSDDSPTSDAPARAPEPSGTPEPADDKAPEPQETPEVSAAGNAPPSEAALPADAPGKKSDVKHPPDDDDDDDDSAGTSSTTAATAKKRKRSPEPESSETSHPADPAATNDAPPLPADEVPPPLPDEEPPAQQDDGWEALWDHNVAAYYFYNRHTGVTQWENPRVPEASSPAIAAAPGTTGYGSSSLGSPPRKRVGGYNPAIHGDFDPNADYAQDYVEGDDETAVDPNAAAAMHAAAVGDPYAQTATFNRFTGRFQPANLAPELHNDENKSKRQLNAFFDVDAAANSHDGRSLKAERQNKRLSKKELQAFKAKAAKKKEEKRRAWLRD
ncbi:WW domain-containing protein [Macrophomina phaseolina]|uniref:WW domain-containing protein n=1 Tax=Macrophomina phaseolina TaxID=35725 RepID=A0ABQ8GF33_9PEZI|nr:WW domain-containing protein [Macrophomina phaseolina]